MARVKPRVKVPKKASIGDLITVKSMLSHPMESGHRTDRTTGELRPRKIINKFVARFQGEVVVDLEVEPAVSSNPYFEFDMTFPGEGVMSFTWIDDDGSVFEAEKKIFAA